MAMTDALQLLCSHPSQTPAVWLRAGDIKQPEYKPKNYDASQIGILPSPEGRWQNAFVTVNGVNSNEYSLEKTHGKGDFYELEKR